MFENFDTPLPDLNAYLARIGIDRPAAPDREFLDRLILGHQTHIPFEDLDSRIYKKPISLAIPDLFRKMVTDRRGGFCFEMNGLFCRALKDLGFTAFPVFCRIRDGVPGVFPCLHRGTIVYLDGDPWFCDVGFGGPQPPFAVPVRDPAGAEGYGESFRTEERDDGWHMLLRLLSDGTWAETMDFRLIPETPQEFIPACWYCSESSDAFFADNLIVNLRTASGSKSLTNDVLRIRDGGTLREEKLGSREETLQVLEREFGIVLPQ